METRVFDKKIKKYFYLMLFLKEFKLLLQFKNSRYPAVLTVKRQVLKPLTLLLQQNSKII